MRTCSPTTTSPRRATSSTATPTPVGCSRTRSCTRISAWPSVRQWRNGARRCSRRGGRCTRCGTRPDSAPGPVGSSTTTRPAARSSSRCATSGRTIVCCAQGPWRTDRQPGAGRRVAADIGPGRGRVPRHHLRDLPLGLRDATAQATTTPIRRVASSVSSQPRAAPGSARIQRVRRTGVHVVPRVAPSGGSRARAGHAARCVGEDRILWGTDSIWYGSPQSLIDAFRAFTIPERMQDEFGYPALTDRGEGQDPQHECRGALRRGPSGGTPSRHRRLAPSGASRAQMPASPKT